LYLLTNKVVVLITTTYTKAVVLITTTYAISQHSKS